MFNGLPIAVINGIEKFGALKLAEVLARSDIKVLGIGEYVSGADEIKGFEYRSEIEEINLEAEYWFDFNNEEKFWEKVGVSGGKLVVVGINQTIKKSEKLENNGNSWRVVNCHGVYGPGMELSVNRVEVDFLLKAIDLAVKNKNLVLPERRQKLRLLSEEDMTEALMRACFLSGTDREIFEIWGDEVGAEEIAKVLIDEAKMTRFKVVESEEVVPSVNEGEVRENWRRLRWQPAITLTKGMEGVMQYFFTKADEENRRKKTLGETKVWKPIVEEVPVVRPEKIKRGFEVMIEGMETEPEIEIKPVIEEIKEEEKGEEEEIVEEEEAPMVIKNSNSRLVQTEEKKEEIRVEPVKEPEVEKIVEEKIEIAKPKIKRKISFGNKKCWRWGGMASLVVTVLWMIGWGLGNYSMYKNIVKLKSLIAEKKYDEANSLIVKTQKQIEIREGEVEDWGLNKFVWGRRYQSVLKVMDQALVLGVEAVDLSKKSEAINQAVFNDKEIDWKKTLDETKKELAQSEDDVGILQARLAGDWNWVPGRFKGNLVTLKQNVDEIGNELGMGSKAVDLLPEILGTDGKRREYMVLLQNESELRPTGGFIGSWALLSFEGGKLVDFQIKDIYEADGQLKGHVEPPEAIKTFLGEANWYMRDANWKPDFVASAKDIQWFLEKETGRKVDGVFGIDLAVVKAMLGVTGEIYVPDFKEKINRTNLYEQAEFYSETNSFAGSTQKASFLGGLGKQLFEEVKNLKGDKRLELIRAMVEVLQNKELLLSFNNKSAAALTAQLGWDGTIYQGKCAQGQCFADYLYIVEANLGVNKANYFLYRNIDQSVDISTQAISRVVKISYENTAKSTNWPGGDYKNYLRVYIPSSSNLAEVSVTDTGRDGVKTIYQGDSLKIGAYMGRKEVGFLVNVPVGTKRVVEIRYVDQVDLSGKDKFSYLHYIQKQPGFGDTGIVTLISMPEGWGPNQVEPVASLVNGKILFNQKLERDIKMGVEIGK